MLEALAKKAAANGNGRGFASKHGRGIGKRGGRGKGSGGKDWRAGRGGGRPGKGGVGSSQRHSGVGERSFGASEGHKRPPSEKLHPSWEAKKQGQGTIKTFTGTKITFD